MREYSLPVQGVPPYSLQLLFRGEAPTYFPISVTISSPFTTASLFIYSSVSTASRVSSSV